MTVSLIGVINIGVFENFTHNRLRVSTFSLVLRDILGVIRRWKFSTLKDHLGDFI